MVEWETVDIDQLLSSWQSDLDACNKDTVQALGVAAQESRDLLPIIDKSIKAVSELSTKYTAYSRDLEEMGRAVQAIQETNQLLNVQSNNQRRLLEYLAQLHLDTDIRGLEVQGLDDPKRVNEIALICQELAEKSQTQDPELAGMLATREQRGKLENACKNASSTITNYLCNVLSNTYISWQVFATFAKPSKKVSLGLLDEQVSFLRVYQPVFSGLQALDSKRHSECLAVLVLLQLFRLCRFTSARTFQIS